MDVSKYIFGYLNENAKVVLPGLGSFSSHSQPARLDEGSHTLYPPGHTYRFDPAEVSQDDGLVRYIAAKESAPYTVAQTEIAEYVAGCHYVINKGKRLEIPGVGLLFKDPEGNIIFETDPGLQDASEYFGLEAVTLKTVAKASSFPTARILMAAFLILGLVFAGFYAQKIGSYLQHKFSPEGPAQGTLPPKPDTSQANQFIDEGSAADSMPLPSTADTAIAQGEALSAPAKTETGKDEVHDPVNQYYIVAGCFRLEEGAIKTVNKLRDQGFQARVFGLTKGGLHMVCYSAYPTKAEASKALEGIRQSTDANAWLIKY